MAPMNGGCSMGRNVMQFHGKRKSLSAVQYTGLNYTSVIEIREIYDVRQ